MSKAMKRREMINISHGLQLLGGVVTWGVSGEHKHSNVVKALQDAGLPDGVAREFLPRQAFSRACKKLSDERVIDVLKQDDATLTFQFTKKKLSADEWEYTKETHLILDKTTGKIICPKKDLEQKAQEELDKAMEVRTSSDITHIIQKLFDLHADLFPLRRDKGVAYFVPQEHREFAGKVESFLTSLGGEMDFFPVPVGAGGEASVAKTVAEGVVSLVKEHEQSIDEFDLSTRHGTMEEMVEKIQSTRMKVEAYAHYLEERKEELLKAVEQAKKKLQDKIDSLSQERAEAPIMEKKGNRIIVFGYPVTAVVRWMGSVDWKWDEAYAVCQDLFGVDSVSESACRRQTHEGKTRTAKPANLTISQQLILEKKRRALAKE